MVKTLQLLSNHHRLQREKMKSNGNLIKPRKHYTKQGNLKVWRRKQRFILDISETRNKNTVLCQTYWVMLKTLYLKLVTEWALIIKNSNGKGCLLCTQHLAEKSKFYVIKCRVSQNNYSNFWSIAKKNDARKEFHDACFTLRCLSR